MKWIIILSASVCCFFCFSLANAQSQGDGKVIVAWRTDGINGTTSPAQAISEIKAHPHGKLANSLSNPSDAQPTLNAPSYPSHLTLPPDSAELKIAQYITLTYPATEYNKRRTSILLALQNNGKLGYVGEMDAAYGGLSLQATDEFYIPNTFTTEPDGTQTHYQWSLLYPYIWLDVALGLLNRLG